MEHHRQHAHRHQHSPREHGLQLRGLPSATTIVEHTRVLVARSSCTNDTDDGCKKPTQTPVLPIILAVVIPVVAAAAVLLYLHRRNIKKLRAEDASDKYKSLDFGVDPAMAGKKKAVKGPEMAVTDMEKSMRAGHGRGMSLDMDVVNPYIMPPGLHGSHESLHSLSRTTQDSHDPYRPVIFIKDDASMHSRGQGASRGYRNENGSLYTTSSGGTDHNKMNDGLLRNAQRMSQSYPLRAESMSPTERNNPEIRFPEPAAVSSKSLSPLNGGPLPPPPPPPAAAQSSAEPDSSYKAISGSSLPPVQEAKVPAKSTPSPPPRVQSQTAVVQTNPNTTSIMTTSSFGDGFQVTPPSPGHPPQAAAGSAPLAPQPLRPAETQNAGLGIDDFGTNRLSMSLRPLPPDDPSDNAEQRAIRIRSFYKEYFDDSKPEPAGAQTYNDYYEDYASEYLDGTIFDPETGSFVVAQAQAPQAPYAQPVTRRAMTPPPRAPPRFRSNTGPRGPHMSGSSAASSPYGPPRGMSSMSGRLPAPRKPIAPPTALSSLPTPAKLQEDSMVFNALDFAPPVSFRERQNGLRPDSPLGSPRPFSPSVRPHTPLASSFDDLAAMPSPHLLRKSGTFTGLDFAPPPRFRDPGSNASDAGSIRSNRSGISTAGRLAVRNGAYRVSKIPMGVVPTKDDMVASLRPTMDLTRPS